MKKLTLLFILFSCLGFAQKKKVVKSNSINKAPSVLSGIKGIGIFVIGETNVKIIDSLKQNGYEFKLCSDEYGKTNRDNFYGKSIIEFSGLNDENYFDNNVQHPIIENERKFIIATYTVADLTIYNLELNFYKDILYEIKVNADNVGYSYLLNNALEKKYGNKSVVSEKKGDCSLFNDITLINYYRNDGKIQAYHYTNVSYDSRCDKTVYDWLEIEDIEMSSIIYNLNNIENERLSKIKKTKDVLKLDKL